LLSLQAFALIAPRLRVRAEARNVVGAGPAQSARPHFARSKAHCVRSEAEPATHAEEVAAAMAAVRPLGATGVHGHCEHEKERPPDRDADMQLPDSA
jgi:hypothetical protein